MTRDDRHLVLCVRDPANELSLHEVSLAEIETEDGRRQILESETSLMPPDFGERLSREQLDALIKVIRALN